MPKSKTVISEVASALGTAAARVEVLKPRRSAPIKHAKAQTTTAVKEQVGALPEPEVVTALTEEDEIRLVAYLYAEERGFAGGSQQGDWIRAEQEVRLRRS